MYNFIYAGPGILQFSPAQASCAAAQLICAAARLDCAGGKCKIPLEKPLKICPRADFQLVSVRFCRSSKPMGLDFIYFSRGFLQFSPAQASCAAAQLICAAARLDCAESHGKNH